MGAPRTKNLDLPKGMRGRVRGDKTYYSYDAGGFPRKEVQLGSSLYIALEKYKNLLKEDPLTSINALPDNFERSLFSQIKKRSIKNGLDMDLSVDYIKEMLRNCEYKCSITGIKFDNTKYPNQRIRPWIPSIDRINPRLGYTKDNTRVVCAAVNLAMNQFGDKIFFRIVSHAADTKYIKKNFADASLFCVHGAK